MKITVFGKGNMGQAIGKNFEAAGNEVEYFTSKEHADILGDIVIMAVPYPALDTLAMEYSDMLVGKVVVDDKTGANL